MRPPEFLAGRPSASVLVVDNNPMVRRLLAIVLEGAGYAAVEANDGKEALSILAHTRIAAVLLDMHMPDLDGLAVIEHIRADPATRAIPVLLVTSDPDPAQCVAGLDAGAADYIVKPFHPEEVIARVRAQLRIAREWERTVRTRFEQRNALGRALARVGDHAGIDATVTAMCLEVARLEGRSGAGIIVFGEDEANVVAASGLSEWGITTKSPLAPRLVAELMSRAREGPWLERPGFAVAPTDSTSSPTSTLACAPLAAGGGSRGVFVIGIDTPNGPPTAEEMTDALGEAIDHAVTLNGLLGQELDRWANRRHQTADIERLIRQHAFTPAFQPINRLSDGLLVGHEALTRFHDGSNPETRFRQAAAVGSGRQLEAATLSAAIRAANEVSPGAFLSLNVSPAFLSDAEAVRGCLEGLERPVVLEITEHDPIDDYPAMREALDHLRPTVLLSIDDAGSGFASLRHVIELRPDYVKLDRLWVDAVDTDPTRQALVAGLHQFSQSTGCQLIAEGIERPEELDTLNDLGVELGQGYLLGRPV